MTSNKSTPQSDSKSESEDQPQAQGDSANVQNLVQLTIPEELENMKKMLRESMKQSEQVITQSLNSSRELINNASQQFHQLTTEPVVEEKELGAQPSSGIESTDFSQAQAQMKASIDAVKATIQNAESHLLAGIHAVENSAKQAEQMTKEQVHKEASTVEGENDNPGHEPTSL